MARRAARLGAASHAARTRRAHRINGAARSRIRASLAARRAPTRCSAAHPRTSRVRGALRITSRICRAAQRRARAP